MAKFGILPILLSKVFGTVKADCHTNLGGRGWGEEIKWTPICEADKEAKSSGKPIMVIVHKATCDSCIQLKAKFSGKREIAQLSQRFVMVNTISEEFKEYLKEYHPNESSEMFYPDGSYVPRIMFYNKPWHLMGLKSANVTENAFHYESEQRIYNNMKNCINTVDI